MAQALDYPVRPLGISTSRELTVAVAGAGSRGREYSAYGKLFPGTMRVVAVADIDKSRADAMADEWNLPPERRFGDWRELIAAGRLADILIVSMPDDLHTEPALAAMKLGYHLLLEKPMARTAAECIALRECQHETGVMVAVGHVLRYAPYFVALKRAIGDGLIGELVNIQHMEPVMYAHMAHSFVRGNWHNSTASTPMILAKTCHDLDILKWLAGRRCERISTAGGLYLFKRDKMPPGATARCEGCPHEATCPYSAIDIYVRKRWFLYAVDLKRDCPEADILEKLRTTAYGRCAYQMDNDQPDHLVHTLEFEGGATASFTMDGFTPWGGRRTRIMGTRGFIDGDGKSFKVSEFGTGREFEWSFDAKELANYRDSGHAGGDLALMRDLLLAVDTGDAGKLVSSIDESVESHLMAFAGERSRLLHTKEEIR